MAVALPQSFVLIYRGLVLNPEVKAASGVISLRKNLVTLVKETHRQHLLSRLQERLRSAQVRGDQLEQERRLLA